MYVLITLLLTIGSISAVPNPTQEPLLKPPTFGANNESARTNANSIFNSIHSSMRQWGSSIQHNGMSFFLASIPEGVMLYHGTHTPERVKGIEWLAFEIEHAENFARGGPRRPPPGDRAPGERPPPPDMAADPTLDRMSHDEVACDGENVENIPKDAGGYLHMYRTNRPINRLLYIDGLSAGKTNLGTLDSQDILLLNLTGEGDGSGRGPFREMERAEKLCDWGKKYYIEGYIRTEAGVEIIWCEFENGLDFVSHNRRPAEGGPESENAIGLWEYYRAMSERYHGITAARVILDYSSMVSAFFYPLNLTNPDPMKERSNLPRLLSPATEELLSVKSDLEDVLAREKSQPSVDWQGVVDMIVSRYTTRLPFLATKATKLTFQCEINTLLNVFIDYNDSSIKSSINQCTRHYLRAVTPSTNEDFLIFTALEEVSHRICATLFQVREVMISANGDDDEPPPPEVVEAVKKLMNWLDWTTWKECGACAYDEVCVVAIWPFGTVEDHINPSCQNSTQIVGRRDENRYWGSPGGGPPP